MNPKIIALCMICLCLSGCTRYVNWTKKNFKQATSLTKPSQTIESYTARTRLYDEFNTVLLLDALWVAQPVVLKKADLISRKNMFDGERRAQLQYNYTQEYAAKTEFYVLIGPDDKELPALSLTQPAYWSITLHSLGTDFQPSNITANTIDAVFEAMLPIRGRKYRTAYKVEFPVITHADQEITLIFRSLNYEAKLTWNEKP